ncbi:MAG: hypothetical protein J6H19_02110 [Bacteroidaceae bacterium]|nr:hypothetical protein [Bacteroidaceae bacterium]
MKKFKNWLGFVAAMVAMILSGGGAYAAAATAPLANDPDNPTLENRVDEIPGGGVVASGPDDRGGQWHEDSRKIAEETNKDFDYYQKQINKRICEMKLESCPIDQILRSANRSNHADSMIIKYYRVGQRPVYTTLQTAVTGTNNGLGNEIAPVNPKCFDNMDTILFPKVKGYKADGTTEDPYHPLMVRVVGRTAAGAPIVIAINGKLNASAGNNYDLPVIPEGAVMLRLGRAAGERDVKTGSYYTMPAPSEQYCQRYIMQVEQSKIEQMLKTVVDWDFIKQERIAVDDMRGGIERSGLFGIKGRISWSESGEIYTTGGIYWEAGKDLEIGHWEKKMTSDANGDKVPVTTSVQDADDSGHLLYNATVTTDGTAATVVVYKDGTAWKAASDGTSVTPDTGTTPTAKMVTKTVYEYVIDQKELTRFVNAVIQDAGNGSRTKIFFVDNLIYQALANINTDHRIILQSESNYRNWNLDFESFSSMGTKILIYRHDAFNYMKMDGMGFCLDPRYLEKWVFGDWDRKEYDLRNLFVRNSDAVVMTEYSAWTLQFPNAHARVGRPEFDTSLGVTDELLAA